MYKISLLIGSFIFVVYFGLFPLFGFKVWSKYEGWIELSKIKALGAIIIGIILFFLYKQDKKDE